MKKSIFSKPKLCKAAKGWYVYFRYNGKLFRYKNGLNYIKSDLERERTGNALARILLEKLENNWNPLVPELEETKSDLTFSESLTFALNKKKESVSTKTYSGYKSTINFIQQAIDDLNLFYLPVEDLKRVHIRKVLEKAKKNRSWSNKAYNKHLNQLKAILSELLDWDIIEYNPAYKIKNLKTAETRANIPATPQQHEVIKECLESNHPYFYNFIRTIFYTGIRPKEILSIKLSDIDFKLRHISLAAVNTKTNKTRFVPIDDHMLSILLDMNLNLYPKDFYLFGSYRQSGRGNIGKYIDFIPGPTPLKRDTATKRWKKIVKDGLSINVNMYSNKHAGADAKIMAGIDLDALRSLYGHSTKRMTEIYAKEIKNIYKNEIINKSPEY